MGAETAQIPQNMMSIFLSAIGDQSEKFNRWCFERKWPGRETPGENFSDPLGEEKGGSDNFIMSCGLRFNCIQPDFTQETDQPAVTPRG